MINRIWTFVFLFVVLFLVLIIKLYMLSVLDSMDYRKLAEDKQRKNFIDEPVRGTFFDRNGRELTQNKEVVWVAYNKKVPKRFDDELEAKKMVRNGLVKSADIVFSDDEAMEKIAKALNKPKEEIYKRIYEDKKNSNYVWFIKNAEPEVYKKIRDLHIRGVNPEIRKIRYYPEKLVASRILGATSSAGIALEGMELYYDDLLKGIEGKYTANKFWDGTPVAGTEEVISQRVDGNDIYLTIDLNIQYYAENALKKMAEMYNPDYAMAVVMNPQDGEILALANYPFYDPNDKANFKSKAAQNFAVEMAYEPGSTSKAFTVSAAINEGVGVNDILGVCTGRRHIGSNSFKCDLHYPYNNGHGSINNKIIIQESCNIGASYLGDKLGKQKLYNYLSNFGLIGYTSNQFGDEAYSYVPNPSTWSEIGKANISFGQGLNTTILSMAAGYSIIANGGTYYKPKIIKSVISHEGKELKEFTKKNKLADGSIKEKTIPLTLDDPGKRIISKETSQKVTDLLVNCIKEGTGKRAQIENVLCAGKTGSAQMVENGRYSSGRLASFIGFAPANNPEIVVAVWVIKPKGSTYGGVVAAPVWKEITEKTLRYRKVQFDEPIGSNNDL